MSAWAFGDRHLSLYIRVESSFYTHRKTLRLKALIGSDAFWVPPRLWAYAAGHQPDGCFKDYTPEEIAMLICYVGDAKALLEALLKAGFMDKQPLRVHDWHQYNGILDFFSKRAKKAADARWEKERNKEKDQIKVDQIRSEQSRSETSIASSNASSITEGGSDLEWETAKKWWQDWLKNGADYTEFEAKGAFLALQANGWRWGKNPVVDHRAALERQIQTDRERKPNGHTPTNTHKDGSPLLNIKRL